MLHKRMDNISLKFGEKAENIADLKKVGKNPDQTPFPNA